MALRQLMFVLKSCYKSRFQRKGDLTVSSVNHFSLPTHSFFNLWPISTNSDGVAEFPMTLCFFECYKKPHTQRRRNQVSVWGKNKYNSAVFCHKLIWKTHWHICTDKPIALCSDGGCSTGKKYSHAWREEICRTQDRIWWQIGFITSIARKSSTVY